MTTNSDYKDFKSKDMVKLYFELGAGGYESIPNLLLVARQKHRNGCPPGKDVEQSWKGVKGSGLEKVIKLILEKQLDEFELELLPLKIVKDLLFIDFGTYGLHHPDVDLAVFQRSTCRVIAILSIKSSLRERATQTAYWRNKLRSNPSTAHVKVFFVTPNSDDTLLSCRESPIKQRAILETDVDATYILNMPGRRIDHYLYEGKASNIRLAENLARDLFALSLS